LSTGVPPGESPLANTARTLDRTAVFPRNDQVSSARGSTDADVLNNALRRY